METLTKENFWDEMSQKYPNAMKLFLDWVDEYKTVNDWNILFNEGLQFTNNDYSKAPKFHELPIAMQWGIFLEWSYPFMWTESTQRKEVGFIHSIERGIHYILRWKEFRLRDVEPFDRIEPI